MTVTEKAKRAGRKSLVSKRKDLLQGLWGGELDELKIWNRHDHDGYTTVPRTLTYINRILDYLAGTGSPLSQTYLSLWCRVFDEGFIEIRDKESFAYESGFSGQRAVSTWTVRMRKLKELGFITTKPGASGEFQYVLLLNPLSVIQKIYENKDKDERYNALLGRMQEVGAKWE
ncbi:hypothetical protein [Yersinia aleksiciae]|uniref:hypothetical protein n=1 Tax=Yersinia aleksiciae TaxID=263819 RepID=UPI00090930F4|nr:hypothetical protein [Yersinia aleksiciae]